MALDVGDRTLRLDKFLTEMGIGSRSEVKQGIKKGFAKINGEVAKRPEVKVDTSDHVTWKGTPVLYVEYEYIMLNKPAGVVSATEDSRDRTVVDLIKDCLFLVLVQFFFDAAPKFRHIQFPLFCC